jgi:hypothetical protein
VRELPARSRGSDEAALPLPALRRAVGAHLEGSAGEMKVGERFKPTLKHADIVDRQKQLPGSAKMQYRRLVRYSNGKGVCWPALETLSVELGLSVRQIERNNATLESAKLVEHRRGGRGRSNTYYFLWHEIFEHPDTTSMSHQEAKNVQSRCDMDDAMIRHPRRNDATSVSNESVMNSLGRSHRKAARASGAQATPTPPPTPSSAPSLAAAARSNPRGIEVVMEDLCVPDRHKQNTRSILEGIANGKNPSELPKVPRDFSPRLALAVSEFSGRTIRPEELEEPN